MAEYKDETEHILEICLENMADRRWTLEECLNRYPAFRSEIEPTLRLAAALQQGQALRPRAKFRSGARSRMSERLKHSHRRTAPSRSRYTVPRRWVTYGAVIVAVLIFAASSAGTIYAADGSLPGEPLYGVKVGVEQAQLTFSPPGQAVGLRMAFADRRLHEAEILAARGDQADLKIALDGYDLLIDQVSQSLDSNTAEDVQSLTSIDQALSTHQARLQALLALVPEPAQKGISRAIEVSKHGQEQAVQAKQKHPKKPASEATPQPTPTAQPTWELTPTPTPTPTPIHPGQGNPNPPKGKPTDTPGNGPPTDKPGIKGSSVEGMRFAY